jgi:hypothetical protein
VQIEDYRFLRHGDTGYNPSSWEAKVDKFEASLNYLARPCLSQANQTEKSLPS